MTASNAYVQNNIAYLKSQNNNRISKYNRNLRRYLYSPNQNIENIRDGSSLVGYRGYDVTQQDVLPTAQLNVIGSVVDTLVSKISQSKVRAFFNTINGTYKDIKIAKQCQQFFDLYYDQEKVYSKVSEAFRDCCIFDTGFLYVDIEDNKIKKLFPWQVYLDSAETTYNVNSRLYIEYKDYPDAKKKYVTKGIYIDLNEKIYATIINGKVESKTEWKASRLPIIKLQYSKSIIGNSSKSVVDMLYSIQLQIDSTISSIQEAMSLSNAMTYFVPEGSGVNVTKLNNRVGNVVTYKTSPSLTSSPVTVSTPAFIDPQYLQMLEMYEAQAYEMVGISMLAAQSRKPSGLDSGVALTTMEDISSERFETQLQQIINCYIDIATTCIQVFDKDQDILPTRKDRSSLKWKDVIKQTESLSIQYSAADKLSKDPSVKLQQLQMLAQSGIIPQHRIAQFLEIPDLESGYNIASNALSATMSVIDECIEKDLYEVPDYIPYLLLKEEVINTQLSLRSASFEKNKEDIEKLTKLYKIIESKEAILRKTIEPKAVEVDADLDDPTVTEQQIEDPSETWEYN